MSSREKRKSVNFGARYLLSGLFWVIILFGFVAEGREPSKKQKSPDLQSSNVHSARCQKRSLARRNCDLSLGKYVLSLTHDRISMSNGVWKNIQDLPFKEEGTQWERVELSQLGNRWFIEFEFLTQAQGEANIQNLVWIIYELHDSDWNKKMERVVQKRRIRLENEASSLEDSKSFLRDAKEKFGFRLNSAGQIEWWSGHQKGVW